MMYETSTALVRQIQLDMRAAMKDRDAIKANALKDLLARFSNEEAVDIRTTSLPTVTTEIPGAHAGVGSTEVSRKELTRADHERIIADEIAEMRQVVAQLEQPSNYKAELEQKIALFSGYIVS